MVRLRSSDGETLEVDEAVAFQSPTIREMIQNQGANNEIHLANVTSATLASVIEYCTKHVETPDDELRAWDAEFVNVDRDPLFALIRAANDLGIQSLLDLTTQRAADMIRDRTPEEIRNFFNINIEERTPEEQEEIRRENQWAFE